MARSLRESEKANLQRLANEFPDLKSPEHRGQFHRYLEDTYIRGVDKPLTYDELRQAYMVWRQR